MPRLEPHAGNRQAAAEIPDNAIGRLRRHLIAGCDVPEPHLKRPINLAPLGPLDRADDLAVPEQPIDVHDRLAVRQIVDHLVQMPRDDVEAEFDRSLA